MSLEWKYKCCPNSLQPSTCFLRRCSYHFECIWMTLNLQNWMYKYCGRPLLWMIAAWLYQCYHHFKKMKFIVFVWLHRNWASLWAYWFHINWYVWIFHTIYTVDLTFTDRRTQCHKNQDFNRDVEDSAAARTDEFRGWSYPKWVVFFSRRFKKSYMEMKRRKCSRTALIQKWHAEISSHNLLVHFRDTCWEVIMIACIV